VQIAMPHQPAFLSLRKSRTSRIYKFLFGIRLNQCHSLATADPADIPKATQYVRVALKERAAGQRARDPALRLFGEILSRTTASSLKALRLRTRWERRPVPGGQ